MRRLTYLLPLHRGFSGRHRARVLLFLVVASVIAGCGRRRDAAAPVLVPAGALLAEGMPMRVDMAYPVMLGIDVLEADSFAAVQGKRIGLLSHPAGVNRRGESTAAVLSRAPGVKLAALFAPEHGLYGTEAASAQVGDLTDARTGLPVYSLHGQNRRPTPAQLKGLDALVVDLQDIGVRSYTYGVTLKYALEACFQNGVECVVLDRPNPLGGVKVDGPLLDPEWRSGVGAYPIPYVHGLTIGELARYAAGTPGVMDVPDDVRRKGRLTVVPMRGWRREMRWPETGLKFVATSPNIPDFEAVVGYAMCGLGCEYSGFTHGIGTAHPFRSLLYKDTHASRLEKELRSWDLPGLAYRLIPAGEVNGREITRVWVDVQDWEAWNPTELSFHLLRLACRYDPPNPFLKLGAKESRSFNIHVGSTAWWNALLLRGADVDVDAFIHTWKGKAAAFREESRAFWLYP